MLFRGQVGESALGVAVVSPHSRYSFSFEWGKTPVLLYKSKKEFYYKQ